MKKAIIINIIVAFLLFWGTSLYSAPPEITKVTPNEIVYKYESGWVTSVYVEGSGFDNGTSVSVKKHDGQDWTEIGNVIFLNEGDLKFTIKCTFNKTYIDSIVSDPNDSFDLKLKNLSGEDELENALKIVYPNIVVKGIEPNKVGMGELKYFKVSGENFAKGMKMIFKKGDKEFVIWQSIYDVQNNTLVEFSFTPSESIGAGKMDLIAFYQPYDGAPSSEPKVLQGAIEVLGGSSGPPEIVSVSPTIVIKGAVVTMTIFGKNTHFGKNNSAVFFDDNCINSTTSEPFPKVISATPEKLVIEFKVNTCAKVGSKQIKVGTTIPGGNNEVVEKAGAFAVYDTTYWKSLTKKFLPPPKPKYNFPSF